MIEDKEKILTAFTPHIKSERLSEFLDDADSIILEELMASFTAERHYLTGKLIDDISTDVELNRGGFIVNYLSYKYGAYLNNGVPAARIPYTRGSGAGHSLYIAGLMKYVRLRMGITDPQRQKSVAFAIATVQKKKGMPIRTNGKGTQWAEKAADKSTSKISGLMSDLAEDVVVVNLRDIQNKINKAK